MLNSKIMQYVFFFVNPTLPLKNICNKWCTLRKGSTEVQKSIPFQKAKLVSHKNKNHGPIRQLSKSILEWELI